MEKLRPTRSEIDRMPPELQRAFWNKEHAELSVILKAEIQKARKTRFPRET